MFPNLETIDADQMALSIRQIRIEMGLTQEKFAAKLGVSFLTVNRWENSKTKPSPLALQKLQQLFLTHKRKKHQANSNTI